MSENCILCLEKMNASENPLECGHKLHLECVKKHFKPECPICRRPLNITVSGTQPELYLPFDISTIQDDYMHDIEYSLILNNYPIFIYIANEDDVEMQVANEDDDVEMQDAEMQDEENPRGDNWEYEDV